MNYLEFFLLFFVPWILLESSFALRRNLRQQPIFLAIVVVAMANLLLLIPLKHLESQRALVEYDHSRALMLIGAVPLEIYFYYLLAGIFCGLLFYFVRPRLHREVVVASEVRAWAMFLGALIFAMGFLLVFIGEGELLGMTLIWASLLLLLVWSVGAKLAWRTRKALLWSSFLGTLVLSFIEIMAFNFSLINFDRSALTGATIFGLPLERCFFLFLFNLITCNGLEVFWKHYRRIGRPYRTAGVKL